MAENQVEYGNRVVIKNTDHNLGGAIMSIEAGRRTDMCFHLKNKKVIYLLSGKVRVAVLQDGRTRSIELNPGQSFFAQPGFIHQLEAVEKSVVVEFASDPNALYDENGADTNVIMRGTAVPPSPEPSVEPGSAIRMTEADKAAAEEEKPTPKKRTTRKKTTKKTTSKRSSRSKS